MEYFEAVAKRYSHKEEFAPTPIPLADLEKIAKAGLDAPNARNHQAVRLVIFPDAKSIEAINAISPRRTLGTAPGAIAVLTDRKLTPEGGRNLDIEDYAAATTQMLLAATAMGYAALWLDSPYWGEETQAKALATLNAPEGYHLWAVIPIGLPDNNGTKRERLPFEARVSYTTFGQTKPTKI